MRQMYGWMADHFGDSKSSLQQHLHTQLIQKPLPMTSLTMKDINQIICLWGIIPRRQLNVNHTIRDLDELSPDAHVHLSTLLTAMFQSGTNDSDRNILASEGFTEIQTIWLITNYCTSLVNGVKLRNPCRRLNQCNHGPAAYPDNDSPDMTTYDFNESFRKHRESYSINQSLFDKPKLDFQINHSAQNSVTFSKIKSSLSQQYVCICFFVMIF